MPTWNFKRALVLAAIAAVVLLFLKCTLHQRRARQVTRAPAPPVTPSTRCTKEDGEFPVASPSLQRQIAEHLRLAMYEPFVDTKISPARLVHCAQEQSMYSVMVCTGGALDHVCVRFIGSNLIPQFSSVRKSFALPHGSPPLSMEDMDLLQELCLECAKGSGRLPFDCKIEFGDERLVKISIPIEEGAADASSRVMVGDFATGTLTKDYIERESDLLRPSTRPPGPPGTVPVGRGSISGIDNQISWDTKMLKSRAATARPAAPWDGLKWGKFYGGQRSTEAPTAESRINHPSF